MERRKVILNLAVGLIAVAVLFLVWIQSRNGHESSDNLDMPYSIGKNSSKDGTANEGAAEGKRKIAKFENIFGIAEVLDNNRVKIKSDAGREETLKIGKVIGIYSMQPDEKDNLIKKRIEELTTGMKANVFYDPDTLIIQNIFIDKE